MTSSMATRREALGLGAAAVLGLAGCLGGTDRNGPSRPTSTETPPVSPTTTPPPPSTETTTTTCPPTTTPTGGVSLSVRNRREEPHQGSVSVEEADGGTVFAESFDLSPGDGVLYEAAVDETGDYEIVLRLETGERERWTRTLPDENEMPLGAYIVDIEIEEGFSLNVIHGDPAPTPPGC